MTNKVLYDGGVKGTEVTLRDSFYRDHTIEVTQDRTLVGTKSVEFISQLQIIHSTLNEPLHTLIIVRYCNPCFRV